MEACLGQEVREGSLEEVTLDLRPVRECQANAQEPPVQRSRGRTGLGIGREASVAKGDRAGVQGLGEGG